MIVPILSETLRSPLSSQNVFGHSRGFTNRIKNVRPCIASDGILRIKYSVGDSCPACEASGRRTAASTQSRRAKVSNVVLGSKRINTKHFSTSAVKTRSCGAARGRVAAAGRSSICGVQMFIVTTAAGDKTVRGADVFSVRAATSSQSKVL